MLVERSWKTVNLFLHILYILRQQNVQVRGWKVIIMKGLSRSVVPRWGVGAHEKSLASEVSEGFLSDLDASSCPAPLTAPHPLWLLLPLLFPWSLPMPFREPHPRIIKSHLERTQKLKWNTDLYFPCFLIIISYITGHQSFFSIRWVTCSTFIFFESWKKSHFFLELFLIIGP